MYPCFPRMGTKSSQKFPECIPRLLLPCPCSVNSTSFLSIRMHPEPTGDTDVNSGRRTILTSSCLGLPPSPTPGELCDTGNTPACLPLSLKPQRVGSRQAEALVLRQCLLLLLGCANHLTEMTSSHLICPTALALLAPFVG